MKAAAICALAIGACTARLARPDSPGAVAATRPAASDLFAQLDRDCGSCHDGSTQQPALGREGFSRPLALRAALMLSSERMPPPPARFSATQRRGLIRELCRFGAAQPARCADMLAPTEEPMLVRGPAELLRAIDATVAPPPTATSDQALESEFKTLVPSSTRIRRLDPTYAAMIALVAAKRCSPVSRSESSGRADYRRCVQRILDPEVVRFPSPRENSSP